MFKIDIANNQTTLPIDRTAIRRAVRKTLTLESVANASISIAIVDDPTIHQINRDYLKHNFATDVISFLLECHGGVESTDPASLRGIGKSIEGEIVLSADTAIRMAEEVGWRPQEEVTLYIVHGLLHLCGYDDLKKSEVAVMRRREREVLESLGLNLPLREDDPAPVKKAPKEATAQKKVVAAKPTSRGTMKLAGQNTRGSRMKVNVPVAKRRKGAKS